MSSWLIQMDAVVDRSARGKQERLSLMGSRIHLMRIHLHVWLEARSKQSFSVLKTHTATDGAALSSSIRALCATVTNIPTNVGANVGANVGGS